MTKIKNVFYKGDQEDVEEEAPEPTEVPVPTLAQRSMRESFVRKPREKFTPKVKVGDVDGKTPEHLMKRERAAQKRLEEENKDKEKPKGKKKGKKKDK